MRTKVSLSLFNSSPHNSVDLGELEHERNRMSNPIGRETVEERRIGSMNGDYVFCDGDIAEEEHVPRILLDKERAEKNKLKEELKEQIRLYDFEKSLMLSRFEDERAIVREQRDQMLEKIRSGQIYERSLIKEVKNVVSERDMLKKELVFYKTRAYEDAVEVTPRRSSAVTPPRRQSNGSGRRLSAQSRSSVESVVQDQYAKHMKSYVRQLKQGSSSPNANCGLRAASTGNLAPGRKSV